MAYVDNIDPFEDGSEVALYPLDNDYTNLNGSSNYQGGGYFVKGKHSVALNFFNGYSKFKILTSNTDFWTISFWAYFSSSRPHAFVLVKSYGSADFYVTLNTDGTVSSNRTCYWDGVEASGAVDDSTGWHHVVLVSGEGCNDAKFGGYADGSNYLIGRIDQVRAFNRDLTASEIADIYNGEKDDTGHSFLDNLDPFGDGSETRHYALDADFEDLDARGLINKSSFSIQHDTGKFYGCAFSSDIDNANMYLDIGAWASTFWVKKDYQEKSQIFSASLNDSAGHVKVYIEDDNTIYIYQSGDARIFYDGVLVSSGDAVNIDGWHHLAVTTVNHSSKRFTYGYCQGDASPRLRGSIDQIRMFNRKLTDEELQTIYQQEHDWTNLTQYSVQRSVKYLLRSNIRRVSMVVKPYLEIDGAEYRDDLIKLVASREKGSLFSTLDAKIFGRPISDDIVRDGKEHITLRIDVDGVEKSIDYMVDHVDYQQANVTRVLGKTKQALATEIYSARRDFHLSGNSGEILSEVLSLVDVTVDLSEYTSIELPGGAYARMDASIEEVVKDIASITGAEIYFDDDVGLVIADAQSIGVDDVPAYEISSISGIEDFSARVNDEKALIDEVYINTDGDETVQSVPTATLHVDPSPQPLSPLDVLSFVDDDTGETYKVMPKAAMGKLYFSPCDGSPIIEGIEATRYDGYNVVETVQMSGRIATLKGGIETINGMEVNGITYEAGYTWKQGYNTIIFDTKVKGTLKISYTSNVYKMYFPANNKQDKITNITVRYLDQIIEYAHKCEAVDYWPIGYKINLDLVSDWYIDENDAVNASGNLLSISEFGEETAIGTWQADAVGEVEIVFSDYGCYAMQMSGYDNLYIQFYVNRLTMGLTKVKPKGSS